MLDAFLQDMRYGARSLRNQPLFTLVVVATLALGIGATSTLFAVVDGVLLRPLPFSQADQIVSLSDVDHGKDQRVAASDNIAAWTHATSISALAAYTTSTATFVGAGDPEQLTGGRAMPELFPLLGTHVVLGRALTPDDARPGAAPVVVVSRRFWERTWGADPAAVGRAMTLNGKPYAVVGVIDEESALPRGASFWLPMSLTRTADGAVFFYSAVGRLQPGHTIVAARAEFAALTARLDAARPAGLRGGSVAVMTLHDRMFGSARQPLMLLCGAVCFLLLIACANVANLLLARGAGRQREMAVRLALGASRIRLVRQLLVESLMLGVAGGAAGLLIPVWAINIVVALSPAVVGRAGAIHVDARVVGFSLAAGVLTGILFGVIPAWSSGQRGSFDGLRDGGARAGASRDQQRARRVLVATEIALALMLLTGAGLFTRSFARLLSVDPGFRPDHLAAAEIYLPRSRYADVAAQRAFFDALKERTAALPGVESVALADAAPPDGYAMTMSLASLVPGADSSRVAISTVSREFVGTAGLSVIAGRTFGNEDRSGAPVAAVLNASAARALYPGRNPLGQQLRTPQVDGPPGSVATVIGVVHDIPQPGVDAAPLPSVYFARDQLGGGESTMLIRSSIDAVALESMVRHAVASIDPLQPVASFDPIDRVLARSIAPQRFNFLLVDLFAGLALLLAAIGLYGVMAFVVTQRTREMGIRMALGATGTRVQRLIVGQGLRMVAAGCAAGLVLSLLISRFLSGMLFGVGVRDAMAFVAAPLLLAVVALVACYIPARRATRVDPVVALRND